MENGKPKGKAICSGFLKKKSKYIGLWKTRFILLSTNYLFAFTGVEKDADCTMALKIEQIEYVKIADEEIKKENSFVIKSTEPKNYYFHCFSENPTNERDKWIQHIQSQINIKTKLQ